MPSSSLASILFVVGALQLLMINPVQATKLVRRRNQEDQQQKSRILSSPGPCTLKFIDVQWAEEIIDLTQGGDDGDDRRKLTTDSNFTFTIDASIQYSSTERQNVSNWRCEVDEETAMMAGGQFIFEIEGLDQTFFRNPDIVPGDTSIQGGIIVDDKYVVTSAEAIEVSQASEGDGETRRHQRRLARVTGTKSILVVRVRGGNGETSASESDIRRETFASDNVNLRTQYDGCSGGKLQMVPYNGFANGGTGSSSRPFINNGVVTLSVPGIMSGMDMFAAENLVRTEISNRLGSLDQFDHIMMCLPPGTRGPIGYAYLNDRVSVFNEYVRNGQSKSWCAAVSIQMHEIGHNLDLYHSGMGGDQYADTTGIMGYSTADDDAPKSCFNALKEFQLGWFTGRDPRLSTILTTKKARTLLIPSASFRSYANDNSKNVILRIPMPGGNDLYVSYNRAVGANSGTPQAADKLVFVTGNVRATSFKVGELGPGQQLQITNYGGSSTPLKVRFSGTQSNNGVSNEVAIVDVFFNDADCDPTNCGSPPFPTPSPTLARVVPAPTPPPTGRPTPLPTPAPVPRPTPLPTPAPVPRPTPLPTPAPVPRPTPLPTPSPTLARVVPTPTEVTTNSIVLLDSTFENDAAGLIWSFDVVRTGSQWLKGSDAFRYTLGQRTGGRLNLSVGGGDNRPIFGMSCGWTFNFQVPYNAEIEVSFDWTHTMTDAYEPDENSDLLVLFNRQDKCSSPSTCGPDISRLTGGGAASSRSTRVFNATANAANTVTFALWNDLKTSVDEISSATIDNVKITARSAGQNKNNPSPTPVPATPRPTRTPTAAPTAAPSPVTILNAQFNSGADGFRYADDVFGGTRQPNYSQGDVEDGRLEVVLGGIDTNVITGISGGWRYTFTLARQSNVRLTFDWTLGMTPLHESDEASELILSLDGSIEKLSRVVAGQTDSRTYSKLFTALSAGTHTIILGAYQNKKSAASEITTATFDNVLIVATPTA